MTPPTALSWQARARALARSLTERGVLHSEGWRAAVEQTPRHLFVSANTDVTDVDAWLDQVYSDATLVVQRRSPPSAQAVDGLGAELPTSSSTMPSLMVEMLEALDLRDGHRVLEIGTGTGYNVALLSHRLGGEHVVSIDIDPYLVQAAGQRLNELGLRSYYRHLRGSGNSAGVDRSIDPRGGDTYQSPWRDCWRAVLAEQTKRRRGYWFSCALW